MPDEFRSPHLQMRRSTGNRAGEARKTAGGSRDMDNPMTSNNSERGVALIMALLAILILTVLAASIIFVTQTQTWTVFNYRLTTQSRYAAEAGVQRTMNWMLNSYTVPTTFTSYDMTKNPV